MYSKHICWGSALLYDQVLCCRADPLHCVSMTCNATTMHHSSWQACPLSSGKSGEHTVDLGDLGVEIPVVLCSVMLGHGYRCSFIEAWSYWVVTFRFFFPLDLTSDSCVWSGSVKPPGGAKQLLVGRGESQKAPPKKWILHGIFLPKTNSPESDGSIRSGLCNRCYDVMINVLLAKLQPRWLI